MTRKVAEMAELPPDRVADVGRRGGLKIRFKHFQKPSKKRQKIAWKRSGMAFAPF
jgi:hypothetical protein